MSGPPPLETRMAPVAPPDGSPGAGVTQPADPGADLRRLRRLQTVGIWSGITAGVWLGAAEAPTKLVTAGLSPVLVSFAMVIGVFCARWSVPALVQGTRHLRADVRAAPHLIVWAVLAGCLWAVANTLTVFAIRDVGLSIAFPLWNTNSVLGIVWGVTLFSELRGATPARWMAVVGGAALMFAAAMLVAGASAAGASGAGGTGRDAVRGVAAALAAGVLWGTMYIPYRKAYLTGMSPLSFLTFFTVGETVTMTALAVTDAGGPGGLATDLARIHGALFWLFAGGFVWVVGDIFQQYAAKYVGISRGIPLSNTNQVWGLLWGTLVFGELRGQPLPVYARVVGGSALMVLGALAIALASADGGELTRWRAAAAREGARYRVDAEYTRSRGAGTTTGPATAGRTPTDWLIVGGASVVFLALGSIATVPAIAVRTAWAAALAAALLGSLGGCGYLIWRTTRFV